MKYPTFLNLAVVMALLYCSVARADTTITYQGRLDSGGQPHSGTVDMVFELYDQDSGGSQQGPTQSRNVQVTDGMFQADLDFGSQPYESGRWLQITVNGQLLTPRQRITGTPFALRAPEPDDCPTLAPDDEMVRVGGICIDKFEASVWSQPDGGIQYGLDENDDGVIDSGTEYPCDRIGQDCVGKIYARSVPGVRPSRFISWFQAQQALANSGKRLPSNAEWQMAVSGTPDDTGPGTTPCNTRPTSPRIHDTGSNSGCVSDWGAFDMVGNVREWVADWVPLSTACPGWGSIDDVNCFAGASTTGGPGALLRGGSFPVDEFADGKDAGPLAIMGAHPPVVTGDPTIGFRGAR